MHRIGARNVLCLNANEAKAWMTTSVYWILRKGTIWLFLLRFCYGWLGVDSKLRSRKEKNKEKREGNTFDLNEATVQTHGSSRNILFDFTWMLYRRVCANRHRIKNNQTKKLLWERMHASVNKQMVFGACNLIWGRKKCWNRNETVNCMNEFIDCSCTFQIPDWKKWN